MDCFADPPHEKKKYRGKNENMLQCLMKMKKSPTFSFFIEMILKTVRMWIADFMI